MGYCYTHSGQLVCDGCGTAGNVRKIHCPFGYCSPAALCPACAKKYQARSKAKHREYGCERNMEESRAREHRREDLIRSGQPVRCSALSSPTRARKDRVHVLFQTANKGQTVGHYMSADTYHAIPLLTPATPDDYRKHGKLKPAPPTFTWGRVSKRVM